MREKNLHRNVKLLITKSARRSILNKNSLFFFANSHPIDVEFGAHNHEYSLFTLICQKFINIRMKHYEKQYNMCEVFKNHSSLRHKLTKVILFKNL